MTPRIIAANLGVRLRSFYRERSAMFFTFAFPVILVLVFGTIFTKPEHLNFDLPVQDLSGTEASGRLLEALAADQSFRIAQVPTDVDATQYAKEHKQSLVLVIPGNFDAPPSPGLDQRGAARPMEHLRQTTSEARALPGGQDHSLEGVRHKCNSTSRYRPETKPKGRHPATETQSSATGSSQPAVANAPHAVIRRGSPTTPVVVQPCLNRVSH